MLLFSIATDYTQKYVRIEANCKNAKNRYENDHLAHIEAYCHELTWTTSNQLILEEKN